MSRSPSINATFFTRNHDPEKADTRDQPLHTTPKKDLIFIEELRASIEINSNMTSYDSELF